MKSITFLVSMLLLTHALMGEQGDTITVRAHDATHMNWYGNWDNDVVFPDASLEVRQILLEYTIGCPTGGCSDWDYDTDVQLMYETGITDSVIQIAHTFTVHGNAVDSVMFNEIATYTYFWNPQAENYTDSTRNDSVLLFLYENTETPFVVTDTMVVWMAGYYNHIFAENGDVIDSVYVEPQETWYDEPYEAWYYYERVHRFDLCKVITPYAGYWDNTWQRTWVFDITEFRPYLVDTTRIRLHYSGWSDGFTGTVDFHFIEGTPTFGFTKVENVYDGYFYYGNPNNPIEDHLVPKDFMVEEETQYAKIRSIVSGHGMDTPGNCAEFCYKNYYLNIDGETQFTHLIKKLCGTNPLYPQAGTWVYDRAGWCPGERTDEQTHNITPFIVAGDSVEVNVDMQPYTSTGNTGGYNMHFQLVQYAQQNFFNDVAVEDILAPTDAFDHSRYNPICGQPVVRIKNLSIDLMTELTIQYGFPGNLQDYSWSGEVPIWESVDITLPALDFMSDGAANGVFEVVVTSVNGEADDYPADNTLQSHFESPLLIDVPAYLYFKTNSAAYENSYRFYDAITGDLIREETEFENGTIYRDTLTMEPGCYEFVMDDTGNDGISWWANNDGHGMLKIMEINTYDMVHYFEPDFGRETRLQFYFDPQIGVQHVKGSNINVYPNPAHEQITIEGANAGDQARIYATNGQMVKQFTIRSSQHILNTGTIGHGLFHIVVYGSKGVQGKSIVIN